MQADCPLRDDDIVHAVGAALDGKGHSGGAVRVDLRTGIERYRRYHIGVYPVFVVIVGWFRLFRGLFLKPDNAHAQVGDDSIIGTGFCSWGRNRPQSPNLTAMSARIKLVLLSC